MSYASNYPLKTVAQIADVKGGKRLPAGHQFASTSTAFGYIRAQDIGGGSITDPAVFIEQGTYESLRRYRVQAGDVCVTIAGNIGDIGFVKEYMEGLTLTENAVRLKAIESVDAQFLAYALQIPEVQTEMKAAAAGAAQPKLGIYKVKAIAIPVPEDLAIQRRIVGMLSSYDNLIATNQRRIALLEDAARRLYREWFVHLRFPGHESVPVKDGVPEGWEQKPLGDLAPLNYGKALKSTDRKDGNVPVYGSSGIVGSHNAALIDSGAIIVGRKGNVGSLYFSPVPCFPIDTVYYIAPTQASYRLYLALHQLNFISSDAAVPGLNRTYAHSLPVLQPSNDVAEVFERLVQPVFEQIQQLTEQNAKLAQTRDLLLPKLMSSQLDVSGIALPDEVAA